MTETINAIEFILKNDEILTPYRIKSKTSYLKDNINGEIFHNTYLDYLYTAYANHYGIEVKPDFIWFTILNEISRAVKENPSEYRSIFTDSDDKKEVSVLSGDPIQMPINMLLEQVFELIPSELKQSDIILNFSTLTPESQIAFSTAFLEAASPFYSYSMYLCGFNKIKVLGDIQDYQLMKDSINNLLVVFTNTGLVKYFNNILLSIDNIINNFNNSDFWENIFYPKVCGSGSQTQVRGWFVDFFADFKGLKFIDDYPKHVSVIEYKNLSTGLSYKMEVGLFSSTVEDQYMVPNFEFGINEITQ